jgi:hypothetical protein
VNGGICQIKEWINLAHLARLQGDTARAAELYEQVLTQARELGLKAVVVGGLSGLGHIRIEQGDLDTASQLLREGLLLALETGRQVDVVMTLSGLGLELLRRAGSQRKPHECWAPSMPF